MSFGPKIMAACPDPVHISPLLCMTELSSAFVTMISASSPEKNPCVNNCILFLVTFYTASRLVFGRDAVHGIASTCYYVKNSSPELVPYHRRTVTDVGDMQNEWTCCFGDRTKANNNLISVLCSKLQYPV